MLKKRVHSSHRSSTHDVEYQANDDSPMLLVTYDGEKGPEKRRYQRASENDVLQDRCEVKEMIIDMVEQYSLDTRTESITPRYRNIGRCGGKCGHERYTNGNGHRHLRCAVTAEQPFDIILNSPKHGELIQRGLLEVTDCGCR